MKYWVYSRKYLTGKCYWKEFSNLYAALIFMKVNGYNLLAKGK